MLHLHGGQPFSATANTAGLYGAICKIDITNKTIRVVPWDGKTWKRDSITVLSWEDGTQLVSGPNRLTMAKFIGGMALAQGSRDVSEIRGDRGIFYIEKIGDRSSVRLVEKMALFADESIPAVGGNDSIQILGSIGGKVQCDDR